jgi:hypothetical protein
MIQCNRLCGRRIKSLPEIGSQTPESLAMHPTIRTIRYFPNRPLEGHMAAVERSVSSMRALANTVRAVEDNGWPANATESM